ncbi:hypothetical protein HSBAA_13920 [Vreelandella sulfidaeris]|uniref:Uncharacterized protein n=1 Tax=Vreelandella sulfidaeris TaxID=115553 RepID=A0A455U280_9GAMM|nr:hypothetical protein HSBAA_13920 [Halomonas sulfidaeris]
MVHLLREESVEKAIEFYGDTDAIPERNIAKLTAMGSVTAEQQLQRCFVVGSEGGVNNELILAFSFGSIQRIICKLEHSVNIVPVLRPPSGT